MDPIDLLAEAIIDTLKEFSKGERPISAAILHEALSAKQDIVSLLYPVRSSENNGMSGGFSAANSAQMELSLGALSKVRITFLKILQKLSPIIKNDCEDQYSDLQKKIDECDSLLRLGQFTDTITQVVGQTIDQAVQKIDYNNDFLVELNKDLYRMGEQLALYQSYNRESHKISSAFHNDLLTQTDDMHRAFDSNKSLDDIGRLISSKLNTISKAIEVKRQSDQVRLIEADSRIAELQNCLMAYENEIMKVKEQSESLQKELLLDELTQINNRRAYELQIRENLKGYQRIGEQFSLILIDIDHFKRVNDEYGHKAGDKCLREIAKLIKSSLRQSDFLARYGGEELIAIINGSNAFNGRNIAEKIRRRIEKTRFVYHDQHIPLTISLGVTEAIPSDKDPETPFIRVDEAMYRAKKGGRNRVGVITDLSNTK